MDLLLKKYTDSSSEKKHKQKEKNADNVVQLRYKEFDQRNKCRGQNEYDEECFIQKNNKHQNQHNKL